MIDETCEQNIGIFKILYLCNERTKDGHKKYHIKCNICGAEFERKLSNIKETKICRHYNKQGQLYNFTKSWVWNNEKLRQTFNSMKSRCYNVKNKDYCFYGAKNIKICEEWLLNPKSFELWALKNGYKENLTIDRINPNDDYSPNNCRWITNEENARYKSTTNYIKVNGIIKSGREWSKHLGLGINFINRYLKKYGIEKTINFIEKKL